MYGERNYHLVQDGASCHWTDDVFDGLLENCNIFPTWPANSPDLNPIESLWGALKRIIKNCKITTTDELIEILSTCWERFPQESIDRLVQSFQSRIDMVEFARGKSIQAFISAHSTTIPHNYAGNTECSYWTSEEDEFLFSKFNQIGNNMKKIAPFFPSRSTLSVRKSLLYLRRVDKIARYHIDEA